MKYHEAAKKLVKAERALGALRTMADDHLGARIAAAQDMIREVGDGLYPGIIEELRREHIDVTAKEDI